MNMKNSLIVVALGIAMAACHDHDNELQKNEPGYFKVSQVQSASANGRQKESVQTGPSVTFDLGKIKVSQEFYFLLENGGDSPIFDIKLSVDHAAVSVSPKTITTLNSSETGNIIPLVKIGFTHGLRLNGVGYADVLPMGSNAATLTITGKTMINGDTTSLQTQISLSVFAELMDIEWYDDQTPLAVDGPHVVTSSVAKLKNTGNVDILVHMSRFSVVPRANDQGVDDETTFRDFVLTPGQIESLPLRHVLYGPTAYFPDRYILVLDGNGTTVNFNRLSLTPDGKSQTGVINQ